MTGDSESLCVASKCRECRPTTVVLRTDDWQKEWDRAGNEYVNPSDFGTTSDIGGKLEINECVSFDLTEPIKTEVLRKAVRENRPVRS
jgi:hypothetical protein